MYTLNKPYKGTVIQIFGGSMILNSFEKIWARILTVADWDNDYYCILGWTDLLNYHLIYYTIFNLIFWWKQTLISNITNQKYVWNMEVWNVSCCKVSVWNINAGRLLLYFFVKLQAMKVKATWVTAEIELLLDCTDGKKYYTNTQVHIYYQFWGKVEFALSENCIKSRVNQEQLIKDDGVLLRD